MSRTRMLSIGLCFGVAACGSPAQTNDEQAAAGREDPSFVVPSDPAPAAVRPGSTCVPFGSSAPAPFDNAVCLCGDLRLAGNLRTESASATANVGVNGSMTVATTASVQGRLTVGGGIDVAGTLSVSKDARAGADYVGVGASHVGADLSVATTLMTTGRLEVGGALRVGGTATTIGQTSIASRGAFVPTSTAPCACDAAASGIDIAATVAAGKAANDNAARGVDTGALAATPPTTLTLPAGRYYFTGGGAAGAGKVRIEGAVTMLVDGDWSMAGEHSIEIAPGASLDLFVSGNLGTVGRVAFGDETRPWDFRLYVGGSAPAVVGAGSGAWAGFIYAPNAKLSIAGQQVITGRIVAKDLAFAGDLVVRAEDIPPGGSGSGGEICTPTEPEPPPATPVPAVPR